MKKLFVVLFTVTVLCIFGKSVFASITFYDDFSASDDKWSCTASPEDSSGAEVSGGRLLLWYDTSGQAGKCVAARTFAIDEGEVCLSMSVELEGTESDIQRKMFILNAGTLNMTEILNWKGSQLYAFGSALIKENLTENHEYSVSVGINTATKDAVIWIDGEKLYDGNLGAKWKSFDYSALQLEFRNYTASKTESVSSAFTITDLTVGSSAQNYTSTPKNGAVFVDTSLSAVSLGFDGVMSPAAYTNDSYILYQNGAQTDITVAKKGETAVIRPDGGFSSGSEYKLVIKEAADVFGKQTEGAEEIVFTTEPEGYVPPKISLRGVSEPLYEGQTALITADVTSDNDIDRVEYYINEKLESKIGDKNGYPLRLSLPEGTYEITAVAYDIMGGASEQASVTLVFLQNDLPQVSVELSTDSTYTKDKLNNIEITAQDSDGYISAVEIYSDGVLLTQISDAPYCADLSTLERGWHTLLVKAFDDRGAFSETEVNILVIDNYKETVVYSNDMENYFGGSPTSISIMRGDAVMTASKDFGTEHGTVCLWTSEGNTVNGATANDSYMQLPTSTIKGIYRVEMDLCFNKVSKQFYFLLKQPGESIMTYYVGFQSDNRIYFRGSPDGIAYHPYETGKWYHITYEVNFGNCTYSFYLDGVPVAQNYNMVTKDLTNVDFRFIMEILKEGSGASIAIDNIKITGLSGEPFIDSVGYDNVSKSDKISPYAKSLRLNVTADFDRSSITEDTVKLYVEGEQISVLNVEYSDGSVIVTPAERLRSNQLYTAVITTDAKTPGGAKISEEITYDFSTDWYDVDLQSVTAEKTDGKVRMKGHIINKNNENKTVYVLLTAWQGKQMQDIAVLPVQLNGDTDFTTEYVLQSAGMTAELYVLESLTAPKSVASKIY